jgi:hypothetical protein
VSFELVWVGESKVMFDRLREAAVKAASSRAQSKKTKSSKQEGLFKQVAKTLSFLRDDPRHPGLQTHEYSSLPHPYRRGDKVFEAYAQNRTAGAYRVFWCYGPKKSQITIVAITPHP